MKLKRKKHKSSISICNEMCKNYLSVTSNAVRSRSGGGARGGGDNFAVRSRSGGGARGGGDNFAVRSGGTAVLFLLVICLFVFFQISLPLVNGTAEVADLLIVTVIEPIMCVQKICNLCGTVYQRKRDLKQHKKADHAKKNNSSSTSTGPDGKVVTAARSRSRAERNRALLVRTANDEWVRVRELKFWKFRRVRLSKSGVCRMLFSKHFPNQF